MEKQEPLRMDYGACSRKAGKRCGGAAAGVSKAGTGGVLTPCPSSRRPRTGARELLQRGDGRRPSSRAPGQRRVLCSAGPPGSPRQGLQGLWRERNALRGSGVRGRGRGRGGSVRRATSGHAPATGPRTGRRGWVPDREGSGGSRQVRGPQGRRPASARTPRPGPPAPNPCPERENAPFSARRFNRYARRARAWARRVPYPRGSSARVRSEAREGMEHAHSRGRGQVWAGSVRSVKVQSATWEPGACSVSAQAPRTRRSARSPQPAGGEKRGEKSPQSYVRKGRVLRGGCSLPGGPAVLLERGA